VTSSVPAVAWLQAQAAPQGPGLSFFLMMGAIFLIFYLLVLRPQQKAQKEKEQAIRAVVKGDKVITVGGLHGVVTEVTDKVLTVDIARVKGGARVEVEVERSRIDSVSKQNEGGGSA
jgi:preprotein translocase subunit YajC